MKKHYLLPALLCLLTVLGCASTPAKPQVTGSDEESFTKAMSHFRKGNYIEAIPVFEEVREKFPMSPFAVLAELRLGDCHYFKDEYIEASHFFDNFRRLHPSNPQVAYSIYMRGMCAYQQVLSLDRDQTFAEEAVEQFQQLYEIFPQSQFTGHGLIRLAEAKRLLIETDRQVTEIAYALGFNYPASFNKRFREREGMSPSDYRKKHSV